MPLKALLQAARALDEFGVERHMTELERKVLEAIESRKLVPRPYFLFFAKRSVFWCLAVLSIVLSALSVALLLFAISDYYATGWRVFDNLPLDDVIVSIPIVWLLPMPFFMASAYYGVRHTRRRYRLRPAYIIGLCLAASIGLGVLFHFLQAGRMVNDFLAANFVSYREQANVPFDAWSRPDEGDVAIRSVRTGASSVRADTIEAFN